MKIDKNFTIPIIDIFISLVEAYEINESQKDDDTYYCWPIKLENKIKKQIEKMATGVSIDHILEMYKKGLIE